MSRDQPGETTGPMMNQGGGSYTLNSRESAIREYNRHE